MGKNIKQPGFQKGSKISKPAPNDLKEDDCLVFSFRHTQSNHCISKCIDKEKLNLLDSLFQRRSMRWKEIIIADRHKLGSEKIARTSLKVTVPDFVPKDANIWALRFSDLAPMVGYYEKNTFYILWLDRQFKVYKH